MNGEKKKYSERDKNYFLAACLIFLLAGLLQLAARNLTGFGQWYTVAVYPVIVGIYGRLCGGFPFSVVEFGTYLFLLIFLIYGIRYRRETARLLTRALFAVSLLAFLFTVNCGINYYSRPFSSYLDLGVTDSSLEELEELCQFLTDKVNETVDGTSYTQNWREEARASMGKLGESYPQLGGYYPRPKPLAMSGILSVQQLCGIYSPFTVEANYNREMTAYNIPHTMCHELSHLKGFMREDEANFIGYLACIGSETRAFQYSGYLTGWVYATNALAGQDMDKYMKLYRELSPDAIRSLQENSEFWNRFEGKVAEVSNQLNDSYLKFNNQSDGVKSYGRMVDLMLAYYQDGQKE